MNVRNIRNKSKQEELCGDCSRNVINILSIEDQKFVHEEPTAYHEKGNVTLITTSTDRNLNNATISGLGSLLNKSLSAALAEGISYNNWNILET